MVRVAVVGASGYTGVELVRLLSRHPRVELSCVTARQSAGEELARVFPSLQQEIVLRCEAPPVEEICARAEVIFTALPHKSAMEVIPAFVAAGRKVVDLSADYRLRDADCYQQWYQEQHTSPELLGEAVYGLPELFRERIRSARLVANPGCYPTSAALALAPALRHGLVETSSIVIDAKSGTSGAGRGVKQDSLFCEVNEGFKAYGLPRHRHTPEIEQTLSDVAGVALRLTFTPHLLPVNRGILATCYARLRPGVEAPRVREVYAQCYARERFVRLLPAGLLPNIATVRGSNFCDLNLVVDERTNQLIVLSAIDNLVKGAAGQALQNMNILLGEPEELGLEQLPLFP